MVVPWLLWFPAQAVVIGHIVTLQCIIWYDTMNVNSVSYHMGSPNALNQWILYHFIQFGRARDVWQACQNFGFGDLPKLAWHAQIFGKFSAVKCCRWRKNLYISHMIAKWIRHTMKIAVTTVTFQHFGGPHDARLPNWMKWYSNAG